MSFKGITFEQQIVTAKNDGGLYQAHYGDGILWGCAMTLSGNNLVVGSGEFIIAGRVMQVDGSTNVDLSGRGITNGYIQVIMNADMSAAPGSQWYATFVESATTTFPALTQNDINFNGSKYQMEMAVVRVSGGSLTSITSTMPFSPVVCDTITAGRFLMNDPADGSVYYDSVNNRVLLNSVSGGAVALYDNGVIEVNGAGDTVKIRPNGNSTGEVDFDTTGQMWNGLRETSTTGSSSITLTIGTGVTLLTLTGVKHGLYIVQGYADFNPSVSTISPVIYGIGLSAGSGGRAFGETRVSDAGVRMRNSMMWMLPVASDNSTIYFTGELTTGGGTVTTRALRIVNLG